MNGWTIFIVVFKNGITVRKSNVLPDTQQAKFHCDQVCGPSVDMWGGLVGLLFFIVGSCHIPSLPEQQGIKLISALCHKLAPQSLFFLMKTWTFLNGWGDGIFVVERVTVGWVEGQFLRECWRFCEEYITWLALSVSALATWKEETVGDLYFLSHFCSFDPVTNPGGRPCFHFTNEAFARLNDLSMVTGPESDDQSQGGSLRARPSGHDPPRVASWPTVCAAPCGLCLAE